MSEQCSECGIYAVDPYDFPWFKCENCGAMHHMQDLEDCFEEEDLYEDSYDIEYEED